MNPTYSIYLLTFLGFPILGLVISKNIDFDRSKKYLKWILFILAIHNVLFFLHFSIKGDYSDYFIFSLEYLYFSLLVSLLYKSTNVFFKIFRRVGTTILVIGFLQGLLGIVMFMIISQDYETDKIYNFDLNDKAFQTRRYSFGFVTLDDTRYTFETYRRYKFLPFEKLINKTDLFDLKSELDFRDTNFNVNMKDSSSKQILEFSSTNGMKYTKTIE